MLELITQHYQDIILNTARIFSSVFEIMLAFILVNNFFKPKTKIKKHDYIPFSLLAALVIFLQEYMGLGNIKYVLVSVALSLILVTMYSGKAKKKIIAIFTFIGIIAVSVILSEILYNVVSDHMDMRPDGDSAFSALLRITLANIIMIPITVLVSIMLKGREKSGSTIRIWLTLLLVPAVTLITFSVFQYIIEMYNPNEQITVYIYLSCIGMILINALVFVLFWFNQRQASIKRENDILTSQLSLQESSVKNLENAYNRTRAFRHDIKNHLLTMNILAENGDLNEIKKYLKEMGGIIDESSYVRITGISSVDAILNEKLYEAQGHNITTSYDVMNMEKNSIKPLHMCIILSNALDNAIEANQTIEDPDMRYIKLKIYGDETFTVISVANPTSAIPVKKADNTYKTTKSDSENHGFGLKSIKNTAGKYDGEMLTKCEDGIFTLVIRLNATA